MAKRIGALLRNYLQESEFVVLTGDSSTGTKINVAARWRSSDLRVLVSSTCALTGNQCKNCRHVLVAGFIYSLSNLTQAIGRLRPQMRDETAEVVQYVHASEDSPERRRARARFDEKNLVVQQIQGMIETASLTDEEQEMARRVFSLQGYYQFITETRSCFLRGLSVALGYQDSDRRCNRCTNCRAAAENPERETANVDVPDTGPSTSLADDALLGSLGAASPFGTRSLMDDLSSTLQDTSFECDTNQYINTMLSTSAVSPLADKSPHTTPNKALFAAGSSQRDIPPNIGGSSSISRRVATRSPSLAPATSGTLRLGLSAGRSAHISQRTNTPAQLQTAVRKNSPGGSSRLSVASTRSKQRISSHQEDSQTVTSQGTKSIASFFRRGLSSPNKSVSSGTEEHQPSTRSFRRVASGGSRWTTAQPSKSGFRHFLGQKRPPASSPSRSVGSSSSRRGLGSRSLEAIVQQLGREPLGGNTVSRKTTSPSNRVRRPKHMRLNGTTPPPVALASRGGSSILQSRGEASTKARLLQDFFLGNRCPFCGDVKYDPRIQGTPGCKCLRCSIPKFNYCLECGLRGHGRHDKKVKCPLHKKNIGGSGLNFESLMATSGVCQRCMLPGCRLLLERKKQVPCGARRGMFLLFASSFPDPADYEKALVRAFFKTEKDQSRRDSVMAQLYIRANSLKRKGKQQP